MEDRAGCVIAPHRVLAFPVSLGGYRSSGVQPGYLGAVRPPTSPKSSQAVVSVHVMWLGSGAEVFSLPSSTRGKHASASVVVSEIYGGGAGDAEFLKLGCEERVIAPYSVSCCIVTWPCMGVRVSVWMSPDVAKGLSTKISWRREGRVLRIGIWCAPGHGFTEFLSPRE